MMYKWYTYVYARLIDRIRRPAGLFQPPLMRRFCDVATCATPAHLKALKGPALVDHALANTMSCQSGAALYPQSTGRATSSSTTAATGADWPTIRGEVMYT
jgi:hypothetical protein